MDQIKQDIAKMEKALATAGGPLTPAMLTKTKIKSEEPSKSMTWIAIFSIIIFIGLFSYLLFFLVLAPFVGAIDSTDVKTLTSLLRELKWLRPVIQFILRFETKILTIAQPSRNTN